MSVYVNTMMSVDSALAYRSASVKVNLEPYAQLNVDKKSLITTDIWT